MGGCYLRLEWSGKASWRREHLNRELRKEREGISVGSEGRARQAKAPRWK